MSKNKPKSAMAALLDFSELKEPEESFVETPVSTTASETLGHDIDPYSIQSAIAPKNAEISEQMITVNPADCVLWRYVDRPNDELGDIAALAKSLKDHGQQEPILIRKMHENATHQYEIIFGNRRWRAAQMAGIQLQAICKSITDQQAALCQKEENENRKELSDYARAMSYRAQIDGGVFKSESELSKSLGISKQALNDLMAYLRVPEILRNSIKGFKYLSKNMVTKTTTLSKNKEVCEVLVGWADKINSKTITAANIEKRVQDYLEPAIPKKEDYHVKKDDKGKVLYKIKKQANGGLLIVISKSVTKTIDCDKLIKNFILALKQETH